MDEIRVKSLKGNNSEWIHLHTSHFNQSQTEQSVNNKTQLSHDKNQNQNQNQDSLAITTTTIEQQEKHRIPARYEGLPWYSHVSQTIELPVPQNLQRITTIPIMPYPVSMPVNISSSNNTQSPYLVETNTKPTKNNSNNNNNNEGGSGTPISKFTSKLHYFCNTTNKREGT